MVPTLKIKKLVETAILPKRATPGSAGLDLYACLPQKLVIAPGERVLIPTGISLELPGPEFAAFIYARSGLATRHGITLSNCVGVIDSDYRGELLISVINLSSIPYTVDQGDRIAQMVVAPILPCEIELEDSLSETQRGEGGFGSTGISDLPCQPAADAD